MLSKEVSSTFFFFFFFLNFGMTQPGIEPWSTEPLANSLPNESEKLFLFSRNVIFFF